MCLLNKALYRLKQAFRIWFLTLALFFKALGFFSLSADLTVFCHKNTYIAVYVDNILIIGPFFAKIQDIKRNCIVDFNCRTLDPAITISKCLFVAIVNKKSYLWVSMDILRNYSAILE